MDLLLAAKAALLGVVEGLTEFIPVSSTGHLLIAERMLQFHDPGNVFTVVIQLGAILAVCLEYRRKLWTCASGALKPGADGARDRGFIWTILIATLPGVLIGLPADKLVEQYVMTPAHALMVVGTTFALGGLAILLIERRKHREEYTDSFTLPYRVALIIGCCQILAAIFPGTSRSGATIMGALLVGVARPAAAEFSFFLAIPAMLGGSMLKLYKHHDLLTVDRLGEIAIGFVVSFIVAWFVIRWLIRFVAGHTFAGFGWYRLIAALLIAAGLAANAFPPPLES
jgi:undecaprenyl-diphosphatase